MYSTHACSRMDTLPAVLACLRRTFGSATGNAHACMPISFTPAAAPRVLSCSCLCLSHTGGVILTRTKVQRPCSTRETSIHQCHHRTQLVGSRGYLIQTATPLKTGSRRATAWGFHVVPWRHSFVAVSNTATPSRQLQCAVDYRRKLLREQ